MTGPARWASLGRPAAEQPSPHDHRRQLDVLLDEFTPPQVVELLTWIVFGFAGQMFGALIGDGPASTEERAASAAAVASAQPP